MMREYLYLFGYHNLEDHAATKLGFDQESLGFFRVLAASEAEALEWGHQLSRWYTSFLYGNDGEAHWDPAWFASWIEAAPRTELKEASLTVPAVAVGEYPDPEQVRAAFYD
jgi:hypothetical protein